MTIEPIGPDRVALYLTPADLRRRGLAPEELTPALTQTLVREALSQGGLSAGELLETEAFPDPCGVLVFARLRPTALFFAFDGLEDLLGAARGLAPELPEATLTFFEERYWVALPAGEVQAACRLTEFAQSAPRLPLWEARLAEHGQLLLPRLAFSILLKAFPL